MLSSMEISGIVLVIAGAVLVATEIHTFTVYLLAVALASVVDGGLILGLHISSVVALLVFGGVLMLGLPLAHITRGWLRNEASEIVSHQDNGQSVTVASLARAGGIRVHYRGASWDAELATGEKGEVEPGQRLWIVERQGNKLIVASREGGEDGKTQTMNQREAP